jgi:hypothetical protein
MSDWPTRPDHVTADWLSTVLSDDAGARVRLRSVTGTRIGTGQVGQCFRYELGHEDGGPETPGTVVCKFASDDSESRAAGMSQQCYAKEVGFYGELRQRLRIRTPRCHFYAIDGEGPDHVLVLEDLSPARAGDQLAGCSIAVARTALRELAGLHAPTWGAGDLVGRPWLDTQTPQRKELVTQLYRSVLPGFLERYGPRLESEVAELCQALGDRYDRWTAARTETPRCVVHGDYRIDNLLIEESDDEEPTVTAVDWQTLSLGVGPSDAAYLVGGSLRRDDRRRAEDDLLRGYHRSLLDGGVAAYDFEACFDDYRRGSFGGVAMAVISSMLVGRTERGDEMFTVMARRHAFHALDLQATDLLGA